MATTGLSAAETAPLVRILLVLGPLDDRTTLTWTPLMPRWRAVDACNDFGHGTEWDGRPVLRALIVDHTEETDP